MLPGRPRQRGTLVPKKAPRTTRWRLIPFSLTALELYAEWIANGRTARALLSQMRDLAAKATELILTTDPPDPPTKV